MTAMVAGGSTALPPSSLHKCGKWLLDPSGNGTSHTWRWLRFKAQWCDHCGWPQGAWVCLSYHCFWCCCTLCKDIPTVAWCEKTLTGVIVRSYGLLNSYVAWILLLAGTASCCTLPLVACYVLVAAVYPRDLVRPKVKMDIYPDQHFPRRDQGVIAGEKLCSSLADVSAGPWK